jgi:hypothetical protein
MPQSTIGGRFEPRVLLSIPLSALGSDADASYFSQKLCEGLSFSGWSGEKSIGRLGDCWKDVCQARHFMFDLLPM